MAKSTIACRVVFNGLPKLAGQIRTNASAVVRKTAFDIQAGGQSLAPVDTGYLKSSIQAEMLTDVSAVVAVGAEYGADVEFGTRRRAATPYLQPAAEAAKPGFDYAMRKIANG